MDIERRAFERPVEFRAAADGQKGLGTLVGRAIAYNKLSRDLGGWYEQIAPGSVDLETNGRVMARFNHDANGLLGTTDAGSLRLADGEDGLDYEVDLPDTSTGRDIAFLADRGDIAFSSFAFRVLPDGSEWTYGANDELVRTVTSLQLADVAPVADPAYWDSSAALTRSLDLDAVRASIRPEPDTRSAPPWARYVVQLGAPPAHQ